MKIESIQQRNHVLLDDILAEKYYKEEYKRECDVSLREHVIGSWVIVDGMPEHRWVCCEVYNGIHEKFDQCMHETIEVRESLLGNNSFQVQMGFAACVCDEPKNYIRWVPKHCSLSETSAKRFCSALGNRKLLIVGDSRFKETSIFLMYASFPYCAENIRFAPSDNLVGRRDLGQNRNRGGKWIDQLKDWGPVDFLLIGTGPHVTNFTKVLWVYQEFIDSFRADLHEVKKLVREDIIWMSDYGIGCSEKPDVLLDHFPSYFDDYFWSHQKLSPDKVARYAHAEISARSEAAIAFMLKNNMTVLDISPTLYRTDSHPGVYHGIDCVHLCGHDIGLLRIVPQLLIQLLEQKYPV